MAEMFMDMVNEKRIDVPSGPAKKGGAYCSGAVPGIGPFQLLNVAGLTLLAAAPILLGFAEKDSEIALEVKAVSFIK